MPINFQATPYNGTNDLQQATFTENRSDNIINNAGNYYLSIIRFSVPTSNIPLFSWPQIGTGTGIPDNTQFSVTLSYNGNDYQQFVKYQPLFTSNYRPGLSPFLPVYYYQHMVDMINLAFQGAYAQLIAANSGVARSSPFLSYRNTDGIFSLYYDPFYISNNVGIYMNSLFDSFGSFQSIFNGYSAPNGKIYQFILNNNSNDYKTFVNPTILTPTPLSAPDGTWSNIVTYSKGAIINRSGAQFVSAINGNLNKDPSQAQWDYTVTYAIGILIQFDGSTYVSLQNANTNNQPGNSPTWWSVVWGGITKGIVPIWNIGEVYKIGDISSDVLGYVYISIQNANVGNAPSTSPTFWSKLWDNLASPIILPARLDWQYLTIYQSKDIVYYQGYYYISRLNANVSKIPGVDTGGYWDVYSGFDYYVREQEYPSLFLMTDIRKVVFTSSLIPVTQEYLAPPQVANVNNSPITQNTSRPILTDFEIVNEISVNNPVMGYISYVPSGEYKLVNLTSDSNLRSFDVQVSYQDTEGNLYPIFIQPGDLLSVKFMFRKKSFNKGGI